MPLEMRKTSKWWYGRYNVNGKVHCANLDIEIAGRRPDSISQEGDATFERSRGKASQKLANIIAESKQKKSAEAIITRLYEIRTGHKVASLPLADLSSAWTDLLREQPISPRYAQWARSVLTAFVDYLVEHHPKVLAMADVTHEIAEEFLRSEQDRKLSAKTWNDELTLLRSAFQKLRRQAALVVNPFEDIRKKQVETISRTPFTAEELQRIMLAAQADSFIRPIITTGVCTALRRGDCCLLKWSDVDMKTRFISIKTLKTGKPAQIPMFPVLYDELRRALPATSDYVFPAQAKMYRENPDGITNHVKRVLIAAGFTDDKKNKKAKHIHAARKTGLRQASIRDFHSFRTTWITMALSAGIPLELVRKVTGHRTVEVVLENYFQPGREEFRQLIQANMPNLLSNGQKSPREEMADIFDTMTAATLEGDRVKLKQLLPKI